MCGARSLLWSRQGWIPSRQLSRLIVRTARFSAAWTSPATAIASRSQATRDFPSTKAGCVSKDGRPPRRCGIPIACCRRSCASAAGTLEPVVVAERDRSDRVGDSIDAGGLRPRRGRRVRRRIADQREGVSAGKVRARRAGHVERRLQRPILHVVGCGRSVEGVRSRSRSSVSARGHSARRSDPARRRESGRDDAARHAVLRGSTAQRRRADRGRPAPLANRTVGEAASGAASGL